MKDKNLIIVESPTKAKTIGKILSRNFTIVSSMGHVIDLPQKQLGVDVEKDFRPHYVVIPGRKKTLAQIKKQAQGKEAIYIATDPDREGEAIGWQMKERIFVGRKVLRVFFHEITPQAVKEAFRKPREFDLNMIEAQASRRILDRIVGYFLSPLLWKKIARGLSAGRVQSVALRLIVEREAEINGFLPQEYWEIEAELKKKDAPQTFLAKLEKIGSNKAEVKTQEEAEKLTVDIKRQQFVVTDVDKRERLRQPEPPFITSTLQQEAFNKLGFNATRTMIVAQQLYEGIEIGESGPVGLITYMRTDSTHVAASAIKELREVILKEYGKEYLPQSPNVYKVKRFAQEAHEAIRPTLITRAPESLKEYLRHDQYKLYDLIYIRFMASQMLPARYLITTVKIAAGEYLFTASGSSLVFAGFTAVYNRNNETNSNETKAKQTIPSLQKEEILDLLKLSSAQHFTKPAPHFSDSSLVKALEEKGIGRPSTYAPTIYTLLQRNYVRRIKGYFSPTELGVKVCELLVEYFPKIMDVKFTAEMEEELDQIEEGVLKRLQVLEDFYRPFKEGLDFAQQHIKKEVVKSAEVCAKCGRPMIIKWGRKGKFLSCSGFPECKYSKSISSGVKCPQPDCGGELIERRSRRGFFYGCSNYPQCRYTCKSLPEDKT